MTLFERILVARGLTDEDTRRDFLTPPYDAGRHDPFLLPDMAAAVQRLVAAQARQERITIYGDYDIDGLTATTVLIDALASFGFEHVEAFIPNRFIEGYGMTNEAVEKISATGCDLIITVDCGSLSHEPIARAAELGIDVIVTDHHNVAIEQPAAVAVINPKRLLADFPEAYHDYGLKAEYRIWNTEYGQLPDTEEQALRGKSQEDKKAKLQKSKATSQSPVAQPPTPNLYPFLDLPGVGVAFKLVQALQTKLDGLSKGQEKWLLDLVALGTVCDVVTLRDENRMHVYWGLKVLSQTRRPGLKALMAVANVRPESVNARSLGFALGPRMNAAGRLETAQLALDMLVADDNMTALELARQLDEMNARRRSEQDKILKDAIIQAEQRAEDNVLVVSAPGWNHGIIGIVAAKLLEKYGKPTFVLEENVGVSHEGVDRASGGGDEASDSFRSESEGLAPSETIAKGSARSYGDFSAADAIRAADDIITKGGGHKLAAGVTLPTTAIEAFRTRVNQFYDQQKLNLATQQALLLPREDTVAGFDEITEELVEQIATLEPFGNGNPQPIIKSQQLTVRHLRRMGADGQHVKLDLSDSQGRSLQMLAFNAPEHFFVDPGEIVSTWYQPDINEWNGRRSVEGRLLYLKTIDA